MNDIKQDKMSVFEKRCYVEVKDVASRGFLTNEGFLNLLENAACSHSEVAGFGINQMEQTQPFLGFITMES